MTTAFPGGVDVFPTNADHNDWVLAADINNLQDSVVALESYLITNRDYWCPPPSGSAATDTAAIAAQLTLALAAGAGRVRLRRTNPGSPYLLNAALPTINKPGVSLLGPGVYECLLQPTSALAGDLIRFQMNPFTVDNCGDLCGFAIDGINASAGAVGLHYGDAIGGRIGLWIKNFNKAGSKGFWIDNRTNWTERTIWEPYCRVDNCTIGVLWDVNGGTTSMGYQTMLGMFIQMNNAQTALQLQNGVSFYNGRMCIRGNISESGGGATVLKVLDVANLGVGNGSNEYDIAVEGNGGVPVGLNIAAGAQLAGSGRIDLSLGAMNNIRAAGGKFFYSGYFNCPGIAIGGAIGQLYAVGNSGVNLVLGNPSTVSKRTRIDFQSQDVGQFLLLVDRNGNNTRDFGLFDAVAGALRWFTDTDGSFVWLQAIHPATKAGVAQTANALWMGAGVPNNADGANGDFFMRSDGGAGTSLYQKRAGAWVATGA